ncbi:hypothetical protein CLAFUW4_05187 [Fulvia fulva]|uniref:Nudix hydrolase domain-containing protein n=1 Tax=Passalora fulva TaxID=5499 RepID=A0A9Q8PI41_PASFU|nr:uncharacterized protein CLAFUR5_11719 [Fulvia fulva]KAK4626573.1 hypothetical protein CLAFUR4_05173 [Fulvia fulva]KAK4627553.1 hypothetical protein CLAFUR0_05179 [Fulvia fulva]UJO22846.1 hypothetical protein CLAFUR5_11719 [Fulvia fulva]WPV13960.1 hypothetical protein CLAFUW4_05187 [Fulvia fulva]WPV28468.1 hypothetical protein CLAFUW7_05183 [Fulvia fulva]
MAEARAPTTPTYDFTFDKALEPWNMQQQEWLGRHNLQNSPSRLNGLATACAVFNPQGQILLVQRAAHDSMPNVWELPGGAVDNEDQTILHGAARELWEEAGLVAKHFSHVASEGPDRPPGSVFQNRNKTRTWSRFCFLVEVDDCTAVKLDPNEHQDFVWASEDDVRAQRQGNLLLTITTDSVIVTILEAFRLCEAEGDDS